MRLHVLVVLVFLFTTANGQVNIGDQKWEVEENLKSSLTNSIGRVDTVFQYKIWNERVDTPYYWNCWPFDVFGNKAGIQEIIFEQHLNGGNPRVLGWRLWLNLPTDSVWNALFDSLYEYHGSPVNSEDVLIWGGVERGQIFLARHKVSDFPPERNYYMFELWCRELCRIRAEQERQKRAELEKSRWKK